MDPVQFAEVVFPIPLKQVFTYRVPEALAGLPAPGMRVLASFGRRHSVGVVTALKQNLDSLGTLQGKIKPLDSLLDEEPSLTPDLLELGRWMADYYHCSLGEALFAMLPLGYRKNPKAHLKLSAGASREKVEAFLEGFGKLRGVNFKVLQAGTLPLTRRTAKLAEALKAEGLGGIVLGEPGREGKTPGKMARPKEGPLLHPQQQRALDAMMPFLAPSSFKAFLLHGVTGSGKTEVYLRAIAKVLEKGKQALVLIPEIALTPQTVERFTDRFGDLVAVFHSRLGIAERMEEWRRFSEGTARVAVGARSALFAPARNLGLIVVDEEHESSYKQEDAPRYHARDAAVKRAQIAGVPVLLGSATPSLESVKNAKDGKYVLLPLPDRVNRKPLPEVKLVDLREEWTVRGADRPILSLALEEALRETLGKGEQALLFLNRRGFSTVTLCLKCGEQVHCPSCSIPVTTHRTAKGMGLLCHYCNWRGPVPEKCPSCKDGEVRQLGLGTERVEEDLKAKFPKARIERMDLDTTRKAGSHEAILGRFRRGEIDLLVGTQMIAKGHDFPGVTLVGVVGADVGLALPDFRSSERVFQLLVQVAGRAGRAEKEGVIYLQTFHPEHPVLQASVRHDTKGFWESELELRKMLDYPPFSRLGSLIFRHKDEGRARKAAEEAARILSREGKRLGVDVRGPAPCAIYKLRGNYRFQVLLKSAKPGPIREAVKLLDARMEVPSGVVRVVDLDPQSML